MKEKLIEPKQEEVNVEKKEYTSPTLTVYGKLTELTAGGTGNKWEGHPSSPGTAPKP
jgi:hypothetical protein